ncbi:hypothetical protein ISG33_11115 [Glaciecola sp. MH2013]|uniref:hypothetical protein n=1 Tax=Glaciecola sp. MH2013 TaxID=2785524 RepID=UPI00189D2885|nr:hypothetical protein [Glaciecola sp. MH2013]MBF7073949.1 hypothetical protein [Glaciecola sp. MH2013]
MEYKTFRDNSERLTVQLEKMPALTYRFVAWRLKKKFSLKKSCDLVKTENEIFQEFSTGNMRVSIEWDNWSGLTVVALDKASEPLVMEIGESLENKYI